MERWALAPHVANQPGLQVPGLGGPECHGVLQVAVALPDSLFLQFVCRIGHSFTLSEIIAAKEAAIEHALRECEVAFAEMIQLLDDLEREAGPVPVSAGERGERRQGLEGYWAQIRRIIEHDRPLDLGTRRAEDSSDPAPGPA